MSLESERTKQNKKKHDLKRIDNNATFINGGVFVMPLCLC